MLCGYLFIDVSCLSSSAVWRWGRALFSEVGGGDWCVCVCVPVIYALHLTLCGDRYIYPDVCGVFDSIHGGVVQTKVVHVNVPLF